MLDFVSTQVGVSGGDPVAKKCFVVMPFGKGPEYKGGTRESDFVFKKIIEPAIGLALAEFRRRFGDQAEHTLDIVRELEEVSPGDIPESIVRHIAEADITIVDLTGRNPNVFFELAVRFALRRNGTILLVQDINQVPFNVRNYRVVVYDPLYDGIDKAVASLQGTVLKTLEVLSGPPTAATDSLVFQTLHELKISGVGFVEQAPETERVTWDEYWARIAHIEETLTQLKISGIYEPHLVIGITNGGLLLADTTLRLVYSNSIPMFSLLTLRSHENYFDNPVNNALIRPEVLSQLGTPAHGQRSTDKLRILVMDDIVGTKRTFTQLVQYLRSKLGSFFEKVEIRFVFLFCPRQETIADLAPFLLSTDPAVITRFRKIELEVVTRKRELPYRKSIHYGDITGASDASSDRKAEKTDSAFKAARTQEVTAPVSKVPVAPIPRRRRDGHATRAMRSRDGESP